MEFAEARKRKTPRTETVWILLDGSLRAEYDRISTLALVAERAASKTNDRKVQIRAEDLRAEVNELAERMEDERTPFVSRSIGRFAYNELLEKAPPRPQDVEAELEFNPDIFVPLLISACSVDPVISLEEAQEIYDDEDWSDAEITRLFNGAYRANKEVRDVPFTVAVTEAILPSEPNSTTALPEE